MLEVQQHLSETVQRDLKVLMLNLTGVRVLQGVFSRVVRVGSGPELEAPVPRQRTPRATVPAPESAPAPTTPVPAPEPLSPSPTLVEALTEQKPTPQVAPGPRLPQDVAVKPTVPKPRPTTRPIGPSSSQNAQVQAAVEYLDSIGAKNIRVNQQQLTLENGRRVGINRPDLQFDYKGRRYHVE